ncbi:MAG: hypothetical protein ACRDLD_06910, partial [Thermoleophilaceae bacterium]
PECCARLVTVLTELGLIAFAADTPGCKVLESARTELAGSCAYRAYAERLAQIEGALAAELPARERARAA